MEAKKLIGYSALIVFGLLLGLVVVLCECNLYPVRDLSRTMSIACDACFFPAVFLLSVWLLAFVKGGGLIDFIVLAAMFIVKLVKRDFVPASCRKAYRAYAKETKEDTRCLSLVLLIAITFLVLSLTFLILNYKLK